MIAFLNILVLHHATLEFQLNYKPVVFTGVYFVHLPVWMLSQFSLVHAYILVLKTGCSL